MACVCFGKLSNSLGGGNVFAVTFVCCSGHLYLDKRYGVFVWMQVLNCRFEARKMKTLLLL